MTALRLAAAAAVIGVCAAACGAQQAAGRPSTPKLQLSGTGAAVPGSLQGGSPGLGAQPGSSSSGSYGPADIEVTGPLRASGPARDAVRRLPGGPAPAGQVRALAAALHLTGAPRRSGNGWRVTGPGTLQVSGGPGLHWSYTAAPGQPCGGPLEKYAAADRHAPPPAGPQGSPPAGRQAFQLAGRHGPGPAEGNGDAPAGGSAAPAGGSTAAPVPVELTAWTCPQGAPRPGLGPEPDPASGHEPGSPTSPRAAPSPQAAPSPRAAESAAQPVLDAAGIAGPPLRAGVTGGVTSVSADPSVQGLPTAGVPTVVQVGPSGTVMAASGWLSRPVRGAVYPIVSAGQAAQELRAAAARRATGGRTGTTGGKTVLRLTGASYGLALGYDQTSGASRPVLVPAWLLRVAGSAAPVAAVAVSPRYLAAR